MTAYARNATGDYDDPTKWTPNGVPGTTDTATIGAFTVTIATGKTWTPGALALTGTGSSTRAKIVIADGGKLAQYGDITANAYNEVLMQGNSEWDLRGFNTYYTVQTGSNVNNKITNDGLGKAKIHSSTTLGRIAKDATASSYGCLQLNNFQITNIDFCFGSGYYAGHHYDLQNGVFLAAGYVETSLYANNSSDYRVKRVDLIGCKNPQANVMAHFRADKDVSGGTVTGIRDISKVTFRNEIPLAYISLPSGYTEVTLSSPNLTSDRYIGFFFQELVTGDRIWLPATDVTCDTAGQIIATSITNRTIYIVDTSRGVAQPYSISFKPGTFYIDVVTYPQVTWRNLAFAPTEVYYDKVTHSSLLTQGGTLQNFFSANVSAFGSTSRPIRESYIFPAKNNPHTMVNSCLDFQYNILESVQPANSNDGGDHFIVTDAGTHNIMYNLIIDNYGGVCVNALGVASRTGTYNFKHNTYVADARSAVYGGLVRNEASGVFSTASSLNVLDNICHVRSNPTGATSFRAFNLETASNDQVKTFDNNAYSNCGSPQSSILNGITSATKSIGDNLFGMHDFYSELPGFVDETRGLQKWAAQYGATTQEQAVDFVVNGVNGYDPVTMTQIPGNVQAQGLTSLIAYVREGFKPTNIAYKDSGTDSITRGALAFAPDTVPDPSTFGSTTGANPSTVTTSSTRVTVSGVTASVDIPATPTGGLGYRVSTDGGTSFGAWTTTTSNVQLGYVIEARVTSSSSVNTTVTGTLTVGTTPFTLSVTTGGVDNIPVTIITLPLYINTYNGKYRSGADGAPTPLNTVYVSTTGSDSNNGTSLATAYLTINKAISVATAGTAIKIKAGTYKESTVFNLSGSFFSLAATVDGTAANPIVLQAYEGDEGLVNLDGEGVRLGLLANYKDYWIVRGIRFINCFSHGIFNYDLGSWKTAPNQDPPYSSFSVGWIVENCLIKDVIKNPGENSSCISPWSTKDWVIRNNRLVGYSSTDGNANSNGVNGIQSYGSINLKAYHNDFVGVNYGLYFKDHYVRNSVTRGWYDETEVYLNKINAVGVAFCVGIRGTDSCESGNHYVHNNVMFGATSLFTEAYIKTDLGGAYLQSGRIRLENNVIDVGATNRDGVFANSFIEYINKGNVFVGTNQELQFRTSGDVNHQGRLTYSDYNAYTTSFAARMNIFSVDGSDTTFSSLSGWNSAVAGTPTSLSVTNPDLHSLESTGTTIFQNYGTNDYRPAVGSPILSRMADGSNMGAYQIGTETMGILPTYTAGV